MKALFVEPPKEYWFVMGEYLPPPYGILQLAAYLERENKDVEIEVFDCQAMRLDWEGLEKRMESFNPDIVASSALATCNTYVAVRTLEAAKKVKPNALTVAASSRHHKAVQRLVLSSILMSQNVKQDPYPLFLMSASLFGLFLAGMLAFNPPVAEEDLLWRKPVIGSTFGSICILGILATVFPKECSVASHFEKEEMPADKYDEPPQSILASLGVYPSIRGHHPDCGDFSAHVFQIKNKTFCTSCIGLLRLTSISSI